MDRGFLQYATPRQREVIETWFAHNKSATAASKVLGVARGTVGSAIRSVKRKAARLGHAPEHDMTRTVPEGFHVRGVSTLYGPEGEVKAQWVKSQADKAEARQEALLEAVRELAVDFDGKSKAPKAPEHTDEDLLAVYPFGDPHIGMYAWALETGADFDLKIAERNLVRAVDQLVGLAPPSREALLINLGDFFHADNLDNRTMRSGNALDVDTRWPHVLSVGVRAFRRCIDRALKKHELVHVVCSIGNHDDHTSMMLSIALQMYYSNNPRVNVDPSPQKFHWFRFGECLLGVTHGDTVKAQHLPAIMANDRKEDWGQTSFRHWYTGHVHHDSLKEYPGCTVETFRTLAARDAWHHAQGYRSGRDMKLDVWHRRHGLINRHVVGIKQITGH